MKFLSRSIAFFSLAFAFVAVLTSVISAQFPQAQRNEERRQRAIEADEKRQRENAENANPSVPQPKPAVVNKNVRIALAGKNAKNFEEAAAAQKTKVIDGDDLWIYLKFDTKLGDYVRTLPDIENPGSYKYVLFADVSPQSELTILSRYVIQFTREDLSLTDLKINLSPGIVGRNAAIPVFINVAATRSPGVWKNQIRIANTNAAPRMLSGDLAYADVSFDLVGGVEKYGKVNKDFESMVIRGTADRSILPVPGNFYSLPIKTRIQNRLKQDGITPSRFYFAGDTWSEYGVSTLDRTPRREMIAVFTYRENENCFYGTAKLTQTMDMLTSTFSGEAIEVTKGIKTACSEVQ